MVTVPVYLAAAVAEIAGCFSFWAWLRLGKSPLCLIPGMISLAAFAWLLTLSPAAFAGRAYAAYGGVYIVSSIAWPWLAEAFTPDPWDLARALICLGGDRTSGVCGPRGAVGLDWGG